MEREGNVEKAILAGMANSGAARVLIERITRNNQLIFHNYRESAERECDCQLLGCPRVFRVTLIPNQALYPKFCEDHRNEYRRRNFLRLCALQPGIFRFESVVVLRPAS